jgi:hypothetical protein
MRIAVVAFVLLPKPLELSLVGVERDVLHMRRQQPVERTCAGAHVQQCPRAKPAEDRRKPSPKPLHSGGSLHRVVQQCVSDYALVQRLHCARSLGFSQSWVPSSNLIRPQGVSAVPPPAKS